MQRVLHVIDTGGPGGAETVFAMLAAGLDRPDAPSVAVVSREGWLADELRGRGLSPHILPAHGAFNTGYLQALVGLARRYRPTAIISHLYGASVYACVAGRLTRTPVMAVLHGPTDVTGGGRLAGIKALVLRRGAARVVFVSEALRDQLATRLGLPAAKCAVIPNGVDLARFNPSPSATLRTELGVDADTLLVGAIGNIRPPKGYDVLLQAARAVLDRRIAAHFVVAGEPKEPLYADLQALRERLRLTSHVSFLGLRRDVPAVLQGLDVFVSSSTSEGFSLACVEAMAAGRPVVATRSGGPETIIEDGKTGLLVPARDPDALAGGIAVLAGDADLRRQLALAGRQAAQDRFSVDATLSSYRALLASLRGS